ncbi:MAG: hypothetical protein AAFN77_11680 [Planctomycetota bacterium]
MEYFEHHFERVEDYLHHRKPYLLIQSIEAISKKEVLATTQLTGDEFFIEGHFPGAPILPGAMMQEMTSQAAGILIAAKFNPMEEFNTHDPFFNEYALGVMVKVTHARYRGFARPGDQLRIRVTLNEIAGNMFDFSGEIKVAGNVVMKNGFRLTNIKSSVLQGQATV